MAISLEERRMIFSNRVSFWIAGFCLAAWAPMIPYVKDRFALDEHDLGLLLLCVGIGSFISMPTSGYLSSRFGCRLPIYASTFVVAACLVGIPWITDLNVLRVVLFVMGIAAVAVDVISNINAALAEQVSKRNIMSGLHGLYSVGGFCGALSVTFLLSINLPLGWTGVYAAALLVAGILLGGRYLFTTVHLPKDDSAATEDSADGAAAEKSAAAQDAKGSVLRHYFHPMVLFMGVMCFIMFMTEGSILDWSGVFLHSERGVSLEHAGYGYAAFAIAMTVCRLLGDRVVTTFGRSKVIILGTLCIVCGFTLAVLVPSLITALLGFVLIGIGASNVVPQLVSICAKIPEVPTHISVTVVNAIGFTGVLIGPALIGFLAHAITLPKTYLVQAFLVFCVTVMSIMLMRALKKKLPDAIGGKKH